MHDCVTIKCWPNEADDLIMVKGVVIANEPAERRREAGEAAAL